MWDNTAQKKNHGVILDGSTPDLYKQWLIDIIQRKKKQKAILHWMTSSFLLMPGMNGQKVLI